MSNDPNDRFMISDLSSKLSAYINGENSDQSSQTRDPADIEDVFASEIKSAETVRKQPGDELFTDLNQALGSRPNVKEETVRKQKLAEEQRKRQRAEEARRQQLRAEQDRQQRLKEEQLRQQMLQQEEQLRLQRLQQEEQLRQQMLQQEEQLRQQKLIRERALARTLAESLYSFDLEQPFTSVRSGHSTCFTKLSPAVKSMPSEEALKRALAIMPRADKVSLAGTSNEVPKAENYHEAPKAETFYDAPKPEPVLETQKQEPVYEFPQSSTFSEPSAPETASSPSFDKSTYSSQPTGESRYAKSPDPTYRGYQEDRTGGSRIAVIIALLVALLAVAAIFIMIRRYSTNLTNLLSGTPAQGTSETVSKAESEAEEESKDTVHTDDSREADTRTDSGQAADSQAAANMAIHEESEIYHSDSQTAETDESGESIPEDPNDITYLASVNEKAAENAIAELSDAAPRLYLSAYGIKIGVGDSFNALSYVERIEDDADEKNRLYRDISVNGLSEFDAKVPGTYELTYFCYDSAGNRSNRARLTVIVE